ncbi:MAG: class I SAM-dependent methyltransferase [Kangiellaceae bacterium]|jgi:ubiquinone/menaquinone biosynthesis C-methylase UbiE|nr:class I SAM-dependent methyltransferase [Kangiellaceae bacterium]
MKNLKWSNYWLEGNLTSLPASFEANYRGQIKEFWDARFSELDDNAVILDVCSGNGAIAFLAAEYSISNNKNFKVISSDIVKFHSEKLLKNYPELQLLVESIDFKSGTPLEQLEIEDSSLDLICSQYGIEYTNWTIAAQLVSKWLKKDAKFCVISHALDTEVVKRMKQEAQYYGIFNNTDFYSRGRSVFKHNPGRKELTSFLEPVLKELTKTIFTKNSALLRSLYDAISFCFSASTSEFNKNKEYVLTYLSSFIDGKNRLDDLMEVNSRLSASPNWFESFCVNNVSLTDQGTVYFEKQGHIAGGYYTYTKG